MSAVLAANRPFLCIPEDRPFNEQLATAHGLGRLNAAVVLDAWPSPDKWLGLIRQTKMLSSQCRKRLYDRDGVGTAARWLAGMAVAAVQEMDPVA